MKHLFMLSALMSISIELIIEVFANPSIEKLTNSQIDLSKIETNSIVDYLVWIVIGFVLGGLLEEILFRGFLMTRISKFLKGNQTTDINALFLTSILFGLCHLYQGWSGVISTGIIGFLFGIIFLVYKKIFGIPY
ncbi:MAG: CPBP family intramembrane metalloprotease [Chitinophagales bacterium]|nr:CPBP family intramembrane metalloprotease [Chitinophagales bacterium]